RQGTANVAGTAEDYRAEVRAHLAPSPQVAGGKIAPGNWSITGEGDPNSFRFSSLQGDLFSGRVTGQGEVAWKPAVRWKAALRGARINPQVLSASFPGNLAFSATSQGRLTDAGPVGTVQVPSLAGTLRGEPIRAVAGVELAGDRYRISKLDATWSTAHLTASGWLGDAYDLAFNLDAPNLAVAVPQGAGAVTAQGRITGPAETPRIQATVQGEDIRFGTQTVAAVEAVADVDLAPTGPFTLDATANGFQSGERRVEDLVLRGRGTRSNHTITATVNSTDGNVDLALAGGLQGTTAWQGTIQRLGLQSEMVGNWTLGRPAPLFASAEEVRLRDFCWQSQGGQVCATGGWAKAGPWNVDSTLSDLPLRMLKPMLPPDLEITGALNGSVQARGAGSAVASAVVDIRPGPGEFRFPGNEGRTVAFRYEQGSIQAQVGAGGEGTASARLVLVDAGTLSAQARLPRFVRGASLQAQPLAGRVDVNLTNLAFIQGFVPDVDNPGGTLTAGYALSGTVGAPRLQGEARLANAQADIPRLGIELRDLRLAAIGDGSGSLTLDGSARSGPGTVSITGRAGLVPSAETPIKLAIKGQRFQAMDTEEIDVLVSPDLSVDYTGKLVQLTGDVVVPQADIVIEDRREKGPVTVSEDVVFVNATEEPDARQDLAVVTRVRLVLGRDIDINVYGLRGKPTGSLLVRDEPGRVTRGTGELEIKEGIFKAYGQDLTIERGRIVFAGPIDNPGIDVRAFRKAEDGTIAGINAKGTVQKPEVTLWSQPTLPESEALAYLLLGRPLNQTQPQEGDRLANAATSLGLKGGNMLAKKLAARWGLEEARIEAKDNDLDQASLVVGKYLSPRLYVAYGIGLFEAVNTFRIRYLMNEKWTLQAESGEGTSADVLYTIER
ncbi:MAG TPA: translocation/assembly module TamB domain-containing protein, partial [Thermoanaerobaculia bacterium]|nr:translocation/assembly module TamB domain-containing protein [Thermoanaerobaculia bacterium]